MHTDRKKRLWPWIVVTVVALPLLYVTSFGPACWLAVRSNADDNGVFIGAYRPMWWALWHRVPIASPALRYYAIIGLRDGEILRVPNEMQTFGKGMILYRE